MLAGLLSPGGDIISFLSIAMDSNQKYIFEENPTWQNSEKKRRAIMAANRKFWILVTLYLIYLMSIWLLTIVVMTKLLWCHNLSLKIVGTNNSAGTDLMALQGHQEFPLSLMHTSYNFFKKINKIYISFNSYP